MNKNVFLFLGIIFLILSIGLFYFVLTGHDSYFKEGLCVDGDRDINLEGMMCEKQVFTWYNQDINGVHWGLFGLAFLQAFLIIISIFLLFVYFKWEEIK